MHDWQPHSLQPYRVIFGRDREVTAHAAVVGTNAVQFADGRIDDGRIEPPNVIADVGSETLSSVQARELAALLIAAADEIDRWATTRHT